MPARSHVHPRNLCIALVAVASAFLMLLPAIRGDVSPASQPFDVDHLIQQLGSDSTNERDSAQKQLVAVGSPAVSALEKAVNASDDPEVRSRAAAALQQMKDQEISGPSLITLHVNNAPASDVLNAIAVQSHAQFQGYQPVIRRGVGAPTVTLNADQKPFWEVMADVCGQLNICPLVDTPNRNVLRLFSTDRNWLAQSPHTVVGPFWISISSLYRTKAIGAIPRVPTRNSPWRGRSDRHP